LGFGFGGGATPPTTSTQCVSPKMDKAGFKQFPFTSKML
jgi:hypothetical protein